MRYLPKSDAVRREMLKEIGIDSVDELFSHIPEYCRLKRPLAIPRGKSEAEIISFFRHAAADTTPGYTSFLGAGAYHHFRPVIIDALISRGEWFTAYTPYQPEISQGTLQAIFEFQTMVCQLTGMEVANASMYDGATATAEAVLMAARVTGRSGVVIARSVHPQYRDVLRTYTSRRGFHIREAEFNQTGMIDTGVLRDSVNETTAAVVVQSPNFFGTVEDWNSAAEIAHSAGALLIAVITDPVSLGIVAPPVNADIVAAELQGFGIPVSFGGPYAGVIASKEQYVRSLPGRLVGEAHDSKGRRGYVLTLATREQHIRREKATSNICTNQALCALMATIFMSVYGRQGLRELAEQNLAKTAYAVSAFSRAGVRVLCSGPRFHEFVIQLETSPRETKQAQRELWREKIIAGLPLRRYYPELSESLLICTTECAPRETIDRMVAGFAQAQRRATEAQELTAAR